MNTMLYCFKIPVFCFLCVVYTPIIHTIFEHDRAVYQAQTGNYAKALPLLQKAVTHAPDDATLLYDAGVAAYKTKDTDQSYAYFSAVAQLPHVPQTLQEQAHYNRAIIHVERKEHDKAIEQCERILQINPAHQKAQELKKALEKEKQQKQKEESEDNSKKSDQQNNEQKNEKSGQKNGDDKKEQQQNQPQQTENKNEQSDMSEQMKHKQHQDKKQNNQEKEATSSTSEKNIAEKSEKNKKDFTKKPQLDHMLERVLEEQEKSSKASMKKFLKAASQERRVGPDDQNNW